MKDSGYEGLGNTEEHHKSTLQPSRGQGGGVDPPSAGRFL